VTGTHTFAALLRGINVGGRNTIPMPELRASLTARGFTDVSTYIQSGNVVFRTGDDDPVTVAEQVEQLLAEDFATPVAVLLRSHDELRSIAAANPFPGTESDPKTLHVVFLERAPSPDAVRGLDPDRSPPDRFSAGTREIYVHYPDGSGRSKLTLDYFERRLDVRGTARNWNTLVELIERTRT